MSDPEQPSTIQDSLGIQPEEAKTKPTESKGTILISIQEFVLAYFGAEGYVKWLTALEPEVAALYRSKISPTGWFPMESTITKPTRLFCDLFFDGDPKGAWECGRYSADLAATRFLRLFVRLASVNLLMRRAGDIISQYHRPTRIIVVENDKDHALVRISQFPQFDVMMENRIAGWIQRAVEISGKASVNVDVQSSLAKGDDSTDYRISWT